MNVAGSEAAARVEKPKMYRVGMHMMNKMKEIREKDKRIVMAEIANVQKTFEMNKSFDYQFRTVDARKANIIENAINIVERHQTTLAVGCSRRKTKNGQGMS